MTDMDSTRVNIRTNLTMNNYIMSGASSISSVGDITSTGNTATGERILQQGAYQHVEISL